MHLAVGYEDGAIRVFNLLSGESTVTFNGHRAAVTALQYDHLGGRLVSGSKVRLSHLEHHISQRCPTGEADLTETFRI